MTLLNQTNRTNATATDPVFVYSEVKQLAVHFTLSSRTASALQVDRMLIVRDEEISRLYNKIAEKDRAIERYQLENAQVRGLIGNLRRAMAVVLEAAGPAVQQLREAYETPVPPVWRPPAKDAPGEVPDVEVRR